ncbi:MAG: phage shock protein A [Gammaproteobacteria bacterium]|jgi:phage shock protein A
MGIFSRMTDIMNANINSILDRAEDPEKMVRLMIQEMEDTLVEVRSRAVRSIAEKKEIQRRITRLNEAQEEWAEKAEFAISKGRDELASGALIAKRKLAEQGATLTEELDLVEDSLARNNGDISQLQAKLEEAKTRKKALEIRMQTAKDRVRVRQTLNDSRVDDALGRYDALERRIDELEAGAEVYDMGRAKSLEEEFSDLEGQAEVADELAALKAKVRSHTEA